MYFTVSLQNILEESIRGIDKIMDLLLRVLTCTLEIVIFSTFFKGMMPIEYSNIFFSTGICGIAIACICFINSFNNSKLNLVVTFLIYFTICIILFEGSLKEKIFYCIVFYTVFAGIEIIFEFGLSWRLGKKYSWDTQTKLFKFVIICLEKLSTFIILLYIKRKFSKEKYGMNSKLLLCSLILPFTTFWVYSALLYSNLRIKVSGFSEMILTIGCIFLLLSNMMIFMIYDYVFLLNKEKQALEIISLKTDMEKKYYDRMEKVNIQQGRYMHDLKFLLKTIGNLAVQDQNEEIKSVIQDMKIRIGEMEEELYCRNKVLNTILCEKKKEAFDGGVKYNAYVEPGIQLNFIQDIDIIIILGNLIDNSIEAAKKVEEGYVDIKIFGTQKGHFLMIRIENKFNGVVIGNEKRFYTTKKEKDQHGIGLRNVKNCIEKYGGILQIDIEEGIFTVSVIFTIL